MEIKTTNNDGVITAQLIGRLDTPASIEAAKDFEELQGFASGTIVLDCSQLEYISSSGLRLFLGLRKASASKGGKVIVESICDDIRNVFMMTGFLNLFEIR